MRFITSLLNTLLVLFFAVAVIVASRITHQLEFQYLLGAIPAVFTWWVLKKGGNQAVRGVGIFTNALLAIGGAAAFVSVLVATSSFNDMAVTGAISLLMTITGVTNFYFLLKAPNGSSEASTSESA